MRGESTFRTDLAEKARAGAQHLGHARDASPDKRLRNVSSQRQLHATVPVTPLPPA